MNNNLLSNPLYPYANNRSTIHLYERFRQRTIRNCHTNHQTIFRINYYHDDDIQCPICLEEPTLPRMDKCGHIFCLGCLLQLCQHGDNTYVLCPSCKSCNINIQKSKRVSLTKERPIKAGDTITFQLLTKGKGAKIPDIYYNLVDCLPNTPSSSEPNSKFSSIVFDTDKEVQQIIRKDLKTTEEKRELITETNGKRIMDEVVKFLYTEIRDFNLTIKLEVIQKINIMRSPGCFNFTRNIDEQLDKFDLFYQCEEHAFVLMEFEQSDQLINTDKLLTKGPRAYLKAIILAIKSIKITPNIQEETKLSHIPLGAMVTFVTIKLTDLKYKYPPAPSYTVAIQHRQQVDNEIKQQNEQRRLSQIKQDMLKKQGIAFTPMIDQTVGNNHLATYKLRQDPIPDSMNLCMMGLECIDPDDDYPHDVMCYRYHDTYRRRESIENFIIEDESSLL